MKNQTTTTAPAPASGRADAPSRAHAINTVTLELNAATAVRPFDDGSWATVFAIHNRYRGKDKRMGRGYAKLANWKKAVITLKEGDQIQFFESEG